MTVTEALDLWLASKPHSSLIAMVYEGKARLAACQMGREVALVYADTLPEARTEMARKLRELGAV